MKRTKPTLLNLPSGSEGIFLQDAELHRHIIGKLDTLFSRWGFTPVHTPMVEYADTYNHITGTEVPHHTYRLIDREGSILMLRSDITLFLMKQIHTMLRNADLPLRLSYSDSIMRYQDAIDIGKNEFFQTGAEIIGVPGRDGDLEALCLLVESLQTIACPQPVLHLGSRRVFNAIFQEHSADHIQDLTHAITMRNWDELSSYGPEITRLFSLLCSPGDFDLSSTPAPGLSGTYPDLIPGLEELHDRAKTLQNLYPQLDIRMDLSELGSQPYHTGLVFSVYLDGTDSAVASGGRYDTLLGKLGADAPAVGFSLMVSKITRLLPRPEDLQASQALSQDLASADFEDRLTAAQTLRAQGRNIHL
ncbi:ATP phosphoribosyltransferase regulatory subunit [Spirochaeta lutea]|uniref:ATP phosphoribosyltransferase regulatory subunit n=1 Tax=Spirochaeta lutea TaxID=1480694 RepID=UPI00068F0171|nr:ATP phosphoribosyltransferase regulatory subunit [Spirochaeta lutea]